MIRNRRYGNKSQINKHACLHDRKSSSKAANDIRSSFDIKEAISELNKCLPADNSKHVQRLLKETHVERRKWIETNAKKVGDIIRQYPQLQVYSLVSIRYLFIVTF